MIQVDISGAASFLEEEEFGRAVEHASECRDRLVRGEGPGQEWLGWRRILKDPNDAVIEQIDRLASEIRSAADLFILCGVGGSYMGARSVIEALTPQFSDDSSPGIVYAGTDLSGKKLKQLIDYLDRLTPAGEQKEIYLNVVSKSGTTLETALAFRKLRDWIHDYYEEKREARKHIICTTGRSGGVLNKLADRYGYRTFVIPEDVGGRYSVLTPVGLLPIAVAGVDIRTLFYGAVSKYEALEQDSRSLLEYAAVRYALHQKDRAVDLLTSFEPELYYLCRWLQQLLGESEGKEGKGLFPSVATYTTDLHSIGQIVQQGKRNLMETQICVGESPEIMQVQELGKDDGLNYLSGMTFHEINRQARRGVMKAHESGGIPQVSITMDRLNEQHLGEFIYFYELFTAVYCYCLGVNPFNQPGVEEYKREIRQLLENE